ncbi:centrosomal protein of 95 kDa isoform X2 [Electrophorus electricus]|uniref:centrosomal protein of 95 kDa isoform X2 n=1 Tax=Electrophorus electricus TaxID=8005 RepID=UPI0015D09C09|nr:centrosomal protein of 95 kDa isoform X2 [Electrophorus electricus]
MGTEERDWVDVANDLLCKCHINLTLQKITDCDATIFVALYEAILGEKVPDYISVPKSQEDDIHNVQSVIDSLALDYLQISLSHITGENVVRGDKDSIRNLLEIFDGLLEYLSEEDGGELNGTVHPAETQGLDEEERTSQTSTAHSAVQSSKHSLHSWNGDESESTAELIRLADSACTFTVLHGGVAPEKSPHIPREPDPAASRATLLHEPLRSAIPLQPPSQTMPQSVGLGLFPPSDKPATPTDQKRQGEDAASRQNGLFPRLQHDGVHANGALPPLLSCTSPESEKSVHSVRETYSEVPKVQVEGGPEVTRRVLFRTQPDVRLLSQQDEQGRSQREDDPTHSQGEESEEEPAYSSGLLSERRRSCRRTRWVEESEDPLHRRSQRNRQAEQELQEMSENLARRLEELDLMLKRALGEAGVEPKPQEEDKRSHHSDSVMECRRAPRPTDLAGVDRSPRTRSLSPSPPPACHSPQSQPEATVSADGRLRDSHSHHGDRCEHQHQQIQCRRSQMVADAYKAELKNLDEQQRAELVIERLRAQEAEREYREAVRKEATRLLKSSHAHRSKSLLFSRTARAKTAPTTRRQAQPRKMAPLRVKENDLLPTLLEEFPPLPFSRHTLNCMWKQQIQQVDQLNALDKHSRHTHTAKLSNQREVEEAQRRHELLMDIIRKEQEHSRRLKEFRERVQQQRLAQNKLREQRQQVARARKYHNDYHVQLRARRLRARTHEERMFRQVLEEGLELQKARLREERAYAKEQRQERQQRHKDEMEAMENYYRDQFSMLAERLALERQEVQVRTKAQEKALQKMKRELRRRMEREIGELQALILQADEDDYFRQLEAERLRRRVQTASFHYGTSCAN